MKIIYKKMANGFIYGFLLLTILAVFVPLSPGMPGGPGLDASWVFGLSQTMEQGFIFGKDIIFTLGPYASIYTAEFHPATDRLMVFGSLYLGISYWLALAILGKGAPLKWILIFIGIIVFLPNRDPLFISYPLIVSLIVHRLTLPDDHERKLEITKITLLAVTFLFAPLGLLPLVKGSLIIICLAATLLCFCIFWHSKQKPFAIIVLLSPSISLVIFWTASGQPMEALPLFFINSAPIISGYSEAMSKTGCPYEIILFLLSAGLVLYIACTIKNVPLPSKIFLFCSFALILFLAFKAGFVRHNGHPLIAGITMLLVAFAIPFIADHKYLGWALVFSVATWTLIDQSRIRTSPQTAFDNARRAYQNAYRGVITRISGQDELRAAFNRNVEILRKKADLPILAGKTDIYPTELSLLIASGNDWQPRPIFQSYSAYTPKLAQINASHLLGERAPDNIFFKISPLDKRFPSLEDGLSWPLLLNSYVPFQMANDFLYLRKNKGDNPAPKRIELLKASFGLGEEVAIPAANEPIFAEIEIHQTFLGRLVSTLFKPSQLEISVELNHGNQKSYRIVSGMAKSGFILSPLVENATEFGLLYGDIDYLKGKRVSSFRIGLKSPKSFFGRFSWNPTYALTLYRMKPDQKIDINQFIKFDEVVDKIDGQISTPAGQCDFAIDSVNGVFPVPNQPITAGKLLSVQGWLAVSVKDGIAPDAIFVSLTDAKGQKNYINAHLKSRPDVNKVFNQPGMGDVGYTILADISKLQGNYTLGLARTYQHRFEDCELKFALPLNISR